MVARITLEFDDQTHPGFQSLVKNLEASEKGAAGLTSEFSEMNQETQALRQSLAELQSQNLALAQSLQSVRKENAFVRGAMHETGSAAAGAGIGYAKFRLEMFLLKSAIKAAAAQLAAMGVAGAAAVAPAITAVGVAVASYKTLNFVLSETDRRFEKLRGQADATVAYHDTIREAIAEQVGINVKNNEELINQLNAMRSLEDAGGNYANALEKLQQVSEATGQSLEDLGVRTASNSSEIGDAFAELGNRIVEPLERSRHAFMEWWNSSSIVREGLDKLEAASDFFTETETWKIGLVSDAWDELRVQVGRAVGANADEYREEIKNLRDLEAAQERVAEAQEKSREHFEALHAVNKALEEEAKRDAELARIGKLRSDQIDQEINKLHESAGAAANAGDFKGKKEKEYTDLVRALTKRREEALKEETKAVEDAAKEQEKLRIESAKKVAQEEEKLRKEAEKAENDFWEQKERGLEENALSERQSQREIEIEHLKRSEGTEDKVTKLRKEGLEERADLERQFAKTAADEERIRWELERDLRDLETQQVIASEAKQAEAARASAEEKIKAAEEAAKLAVEAEKAKVEAIKALRDEQGKNLFEQQVGKQGNQQVLEELTRQRIAESRQQNPNRGAEAQRRAERGIRANTQRELSSGKIDQGEIDKVRADLAAGQILQASKQGKVSAESLRAFAEQAKAMRSQAELNEEVARQLKEIQAEQSQTSQTTKSQTHRLRAQRAGLRR